MKQILALLAWLAAISPSMATHYQVYLLGGQSNGNGRADAAQLTPPLSAEQTDVRLYYLNDQDSNSVLAEEQWIHLAPGSGHGSTLYYPVEFGPEVSFGRSMADAKPTENIAIIKYTYGGSSMSQWSATGARYLTFKSTVQNALAALTAAGDTYVLRGMLWQQGESDTGEPAASNYNTNLTDLIARVRTDFNGGVAFPFVIGSLSDSQYSNITDEESGPGKVRKAQQDVAAADPTVGIAISDGFGIQSDGIHFDHNGQVALGQGHATQMLALEGSDVTEPQLSGTNPADGASDALITANLVATFNELIQLKAGGTVTIRDLGPGDDTVITLPDARVTVSGNDLVVNPTADLVEDNPYAVQISADAVADVSDNPFAGIGDDTTWNFTTVTNAADDSPPEALTLVPSDGNISVGRNDNLVVTFNEPVAKGSSGDIVIKQSNGAVFETIPVTDAKVGISGEVVTINPSGTFALKQGYYVQIAAGAILDLTGNPWPGIASTDTTTWNFTTAGNVTSVGTTGVFDSTSNANEIDNDPTGQLAAFKANVATAYANNLGGVIDWTTGAGTLNASSTAPGNYLDTTVTVNFGAGNTNTLTITPDRKTGVYANNVNNQVAALSNTTSLLPDAATDLDLGMSFSGANVLEVGFGMLARNTYGAGVTFRATATFNDNSVSAPIDFTLGNTIGASDTFLHFAAPSGKYISSIFVDFVSRPSGVTDSQTRPSMDDLGFIVAAPSGNTYAEWIAGKSGVNGQTGVNQDPDGDGIENGVENFFGTEPGVFSQGLQVDGVNGNQFTFIHPVNASPASDLTPTYMWSKDLVTFTPGGGTHDGTTVIITPGTPSGGFVTVTAEASGSTTDKLFIRVQVTQP